VPKIHNFYRIIKSYLATFIFQRSILRKIIYSNRPQEGEDIIIKRILNYKKGLFVDIGAHHPIKYSNTYELYEDGWNGINIEPNLKNFKIITKYRKRDVNINCAISNKKKLNYYIFKESALNTTSEKIVKLRKRQNFNYISKINIRCSTLNNIFKKHLKNREIDLLNIDIEGSEYEALITNDWKKYRPKMIICEALESSIDTASKNKITKLLKRNGYIFFSKLYHNIIFLRKDFFKETF